MNPKIDRIEIEGRVYVPEDAIKAHDYGDGDIFVVRSRDAGVHVGRVVYRDGGEVHLAESYRIWRWRGAKTLTGLSQHGVQSAEESSYTRTEGPSGTATRPHVILGACEVIPCTAKAWAAVKGAGWAE